MPDLMSWRTTSSGTKDENDFSDVRSSEAADSSFAISWIFDGGRAGVSKLRLSIACNCRDTFSTGRDSRREAKKMKNNSTMVRPMMTTIINRLVFFNVPTKSSIGVNVITCQG